VVKTMRQGVPGFSDLSDQDIRLIIRDKITRVTLGNEEIRIQPKSNPVEALPEIRIPRTALSSGNTQTEEPANAEGKSSQQLLQALIRAHAWVKQLGAGKYQSVESLGQAIGLHPKVIRNGIRLAFMDPRITKAILQGEQLPGIGLRDFSGPIALSWREQRDQFPILLTG